jgi:hypothetical protein
MADTPQNPPPLPPPPLPPPVHTTSPTASPATVTTTPTPIHTTTTTPHYRCSQCNKHHERAHYSKTQWKKRDQRKCTTCTQQQNHPPGHRPTGKSGKTPPQSSSPKTITPTVLKLNARPQRNVPGFEGTLTCCTDWKQTKKGEPPSAQSAVFNPLLACAFGPIANHSTQQQLDTAMQWWALALPAFPRWVVALQKAGVQLKKQKMLARAKGRPNPLIHKAKGHGTVVSFFIFYICIGAYCQ